MELKFPITAVFVVGEPARFEATTLEELGRYVEWTDSTQDMLIVDRYGVPLIVTAQALRITAADPRGHGLTLSEVDLLRRVGWEPDPILNPSD